MVANPDQVLIFDTTLRSEEHTSELQSQSNLVCRLLLEKKKTHDNNPVIVAHTLFAALCPPHEPHESQLESIVISSAISSLVLLDHSYDHINIVHTPTTS